MASELDVVCSRLKVRAITKWYGVSTNPNFPKSNEWKVKLIFQGRQLTIPFYTGFALHEAPNAADILSCLVSDSMSIQNARSFEEWCGEFGYDTDSRKAERIYKQCKKINQKLVKFLGHHWDEFQNAEH